MGTSPAIASIRRAALAAVDGDALAASVAKDRKGKWISRHVVEEVERCLRTFGPRSLESSRSHN